MAFSLELAFSTYVGAMDVSVGQGGVEVVAFSGRKDHRLGKNSNRRLARDAARLAHFGDTAFHPCSHGNQSGAIDHDCLRDLRLEWIADSVAESCEGSVEPNHQGCACGYWGISLRCKCAGQQQNKG